MSTATTNALHVLIRNRLLSGSYGGVTVTSLLGTGNAARLYQAGIPEGDAVTRPYPYAEMLVFNDLTTESFGDGIRSTFDLEVTVWDRPRTQITRARTLADLFDNALIGYTFAAANEGFLTFTGRSRDTLPQGSGDVDREVVQIRLLYAAVMWSQMLARTYT